MIFKRFYDEGLAQASYLVGCAAAGEAMVIDPNRKVDQYLEAAAAEGLKITAVTETHIHADFVSGSRELAQQTGATLYLSDEGDEHWKYAFAAEAGVTLLKDGDTFSVGNLKIDVLHTPGHTPEHLSFLLTDTRATSHPIGVFTGDFVFVGDVGRPDLLERAVKVQGSAELGARTLFRSLQRFKQLPDILQIWPGHGAGSACGKNLSAVPQSTIGYERIANWAFAYDDEDAFVAAVLAGQPEPPTYFSEMKRINKEGPRILGGTRPPARLDGHRLGELLEHGALVVDTRSASDFAAGHVPGTINIPLDRSFVTWAGWLIPYHAPFYLLADDRCAQCVDQATTVLALIGLDEVAGYFGSDALDQWVAVGRALDTIPRLTARELADLLRTGAVALLDVRSRTEWEAGRLPGAINVPLGKLADRLSEVPRDRPLVVNCQKGARSAIATSVLRAHGFRNAINLQDGFDGWEAAGNPVESGDAASTTVSAA